jgi:peptide-methionine (S)-S-oxide reductase
MKTRILLMAVCLGLSSAASAAGVSQESVAAFAGGCFWCMESDFEKVPGVTSVVSGYTGGKEDNPSYEQVSAHETGHAESVQVHYDPARVSYDQLLDWYWHHVDPLTPNAQFCDHGPQYRTAIFYRDAVEKAAAEASKARYEKQLGQPIVTQIVPAGTFWPAEDYHQDYYKKNPVRYKFYRFNCGRDARVEEVWGKSTVPH